MIETAAPGLHDAILLAAGIASVYLVVAVLQLAQLKRQKRPISSLREPSLQPQNDGSRKRIDSPTPDITEEKNFATYLRRTTVEADLLRVQNEIQSLREALKATQEEVASLRSRSAQPGSANANVPYLYNEALLLAQRGMSAANIAARCDISMGEAELLAALTRSPQSIRSNANQMKATDNNANDSQYKNGFRAAA